MAPVTRDPLFVLSSLPHADCHGDALLLLSPFSCETESLSPPLSSLFLSYVIGMYHLSQTQRYG